MPTIEFDAEITTQADGTILVRAIAVNVPGLDRPEVWAWQFGPRREALARRLGKAIKAGKAVVCADGIGPDGRPHAMRTDASGRTYLLASPTIVGRNANDGLRRLGF